MKKYLKSVAVGSALSLCLSGMPLLTVHGEEVQKIVVLGDSIASGENTYVSILQDCRNVEIQNFSSENYTTSDILNCFSDAQVQKALSEADIILINAGEHDILDKFLERTHGFMEEFKFEKFLDVFTAQLADYGFQSEDDLLPYSNQMAADLRTNQLSAAQNVQKINQELENYPDAKIIWQTAYNMLDTIEIYETLSTKRQMAYNAIMRPAKSVLNGTQPEGSTDDSWKRINDYIKDFGEAHDNCTVVDVYTGFAGKAYQYTNLYELDFTPTLLGHTWIADQIITELSLEKMGDVVGDIEVNAKDAAAVLVHAAEIGAGNGGSLTPEQIKKADVDGNGSVNAMDAAQILVYAASRGVGQIYHFKKSSATEEPSDPV